MILKKTVHKILSLLNGDLEEQLYNKLRNKASYQYRRPERHIACAEILSACSFGSLFNGEKADIILLQVTAQDLAQLNHIARESPRYRRHIGGLWGRAPAAIVAVMPNPHTADLLQAMLLDFDGVLLPPFHPQNLELNLQMALERSQRRFYQSQRCRKMRRLCRSLNRKRRHLRHKVDLLCQDLVNSNLQFTNSLRELRRVYDFQTDLVGEFDLQYMLHKALRQIKEQLANSSATIYLCGSDDFEAHIAGAWYNEHGDIAEIEQTLKETMVRKIIDRPQFLLVRDGGQWPDIRAKQRDLLAGLSLLGTPIIADQELIGVIVAYRNADKPLTEADRRLIQPLLMPLGRIIAALQQLELYVQPAPQ